MYIYCSDFSETEDWTLGVRSVKYTLPVSNIKTFNFVYVQFVLNLALLLLISINKMIVDE